MTKNGYIGRTECKENHVEVSRRLERIEDKTDKLSMDITALRTHFNENLKKEVQKQQGMSRLKLAMSMSILSGVISFFIAILVR